ncbi:MAG: hypothetical protein K0V04_08630 [Deltaproteobacteria bacterium]|nr:hypothetical protein [Deltaproteobacteria bacterium]
MSAWRTIDDEQAAPSAPTPESVVLPREGSIAIATSNGFVTVSAEGAAVRVQFGDRDPCVLLRVTDAIELHDGDMISAGNQWISYEVGRQGRPNRLHRVESDGRVTMTLSLRNSSTIVGRTAGDIVLPGDARLASLHFQVLSRDERTYLQDMATKDGTYLLVRAGELLPAGSVLTIGDRTVQLETPATGGAQGLPQWPNPWLGAANSDMDDGMEGVTRISRSRPTRSYGHDQTFA